MGNRGKLVIIVILLTGVVAATSAWWYRQHQGERVLQLWGAESAYRIRMALRSELFELDSISAEAESPLVKIGARNYKTSRIIQMNDRQGFVHARQALIQDASYDWASMAVPRQVSEGHWGWALKFSDQQQSTLLAFDLGQGLVCDVERGAVASIQPIREGLALYFAEQVRKAAP